MASGKGDALCPDVLLRRVSQLFSTTRESQYSIGILLVLDYLLPAIAYWCWVRLLAPHYRSDDGGEPVDEVRLLVRAAERETIPMMKLRVTRAVSEKKKPPITAEE